MLRTDSRRRLLAMRSALVSLTLASPGLAQAVWVPLTPNSTPGQAAEIAFDQAASGPNQSVFDLYVPGFWREEVQWSGETYQRIRVPGLGSTAQPGAPDLPAARLQLAVPTDATTIQVILQPTFAPLSFAGWVPEPRLIQAEDGETVDPTRDPGPGRTTGSPDRWQIDRAIYSSQAPWPRSVVEPVARVSRSFGTVPMAEVELFPFAYDPAGPALLAGPHVRVFCGHAGSALPPTPMTRERAALCTEIFDNWPGAAGGFAVNTTTYEGRYLIVTPQRYQAALQPFVDHRKACGFAVTVITTEAVGSSCAQIRAAIGSWYQASTLGYDHYCLLVGDVEDIPLCDVPGVSGLQTDDLYGSPLDGDLFEEVFVGRISVDDAHDVQVATSKILRYEADPILGGDYHQVLLVAHEQDAPEKYQGAQEVVANATYDVPPTFLKRYGSSAASTNASVVDVIENQVGLVCYRGHGSTSSWSGWNVAGESFHKNELVEMANALQPVVWSFSCTNNNLSAYPGTTADGLGECWVELENGGVAHYGALTVSGTVQNHLLDEWMFRSVYHFGYTTHAQAIYLAENVLRATYPDGNNVWMYNLLGCPAMKIRRRSPQPPTLLGPQVLTTGGSAVPFQARDPQGLVLPGILISAYMPESAPGAGDEILVNGYTGPNGDVLLPLAPRREGVIFLTARDGEGNVATSRVLVSDGDWNDLGDGTRGFAGVPEFAGRGSLAVGTDVEFALERGRANAPGLLLAALADAQIPFAGGVLHTSPTPLALPLATDAQGRFDATFPNWPGSPAGTEFFFQCVLLDSTAQGGVALSNGLRARQH